MYYFIEDIEMNFDTVNGFIYFMKIIFLSICTYQTVLKIINYQNKIITNIISYVMIILSSSLISVINTRTNSLISTVSLVLLLSCINAKNTSNNIGYSIIVTTMAFSINYLIFFASTIILFAVNLIQNINNDWINLVCMIILHIIILLILFRIKRFKYGISFLNDNNKNENFDVLVLNISVSILFFIVMFSNLELLLSKSVFFGLIACSIIMFITIQKSLQLYYKQKLLIQDLEETKKKLENKTKEVEELEKENLEFSKKSHTLAHRQKALQYKIQEILTKTEASKEEAAEVKDKLKEVEKDLYTETVVTELSKTEIAEIDNMLKYMQSECKKNKIDMDLQIKGNIHYMTNNLISKDDLEILIADHLKNAIIAINHTDNVNRSILVRLGKIDGIYSLYIYDTGIEFEVETLKKLGKEPSTTHKEEGGTGMGFMNTFDTLRKCKASMIIKEIAKPSKDNFTKALIIKFDNKNKFEIDSYRNIDYDENISQDDQSG